MHITKQCTTYYLYTAHCTDTVTSSLAISEWHLLFRRPIQAAPQNLCIKSCLCYPVPFSNLFVFLNFKTFQKFQLFQLFVTNLNLTVFVFVIRVLFGMSTLFTFCYFGKLSTTSFENMADCMYENNWYEWSIESQKHIVIMIMNAQRSIYYHGFGVALLNLETFTKVSKR